MSTTHVSFSKVTAAVFNASAASDSGVTEMLLILPLMEVRNRAVCSWEEHSPETEEILDFFLTGIVRDSLDMDCG